MKGLLMIRAVWLRWSFLLIVLTGSFKSYGALPLPEDKPAEPKDFATKDSKPLAQPPTRPVKLVNSSDLYICSFNALMQVLWILEPLNTALKEARPADSTLKTYLASIDAKNIFSGPLFLKPFIDKMTSKNDGTQIVEPKNSWNLFNNLLPIDIKKLSLIKYEETLSCPQATKEPSKQHFLNRREVESFFISVNITKKTFSLHDALILYDGKSHDIDEKCACGTLKQQTITFNFNQEPPQILFINTSHFDEAKKKTNWCTCRFPLLDLKFSNKLYDLVGVIFHSGEESGAGHFYAWIENHGKWYKCNDEEIVPFGELKKRKKDFEEFTIPLTYTSLLVYIEKSTIQLLRIKQSDFFKAEIQKAQQGIARDAWNNQKVSALPKNLSGIIRDTQKLVEKNLGNQWSAAKDGQDEILDMDGLNRRAIEKAQKEE
jgi:hypothetical protein